MELTEINQNDKGTERSSFATLYIDREDMYFIIVMVCEKVQQIDEFAGDKLRKSHALYLKGRSFAGVNRKKVVWGVSMKNFLVKFCHSSKFLSLKAITNKD